MQVVISCSDEEFTQLKSYVQEVLRGSFDEAEWSVEVTSDQQILEEYRNALVIDGNQPEETSAENGTC